jgi:hypothetical protein
LPDAWSDFADWMIAHDLLPAGFDITGTIGANVPDPILATPEA